jgi:hypothetical protein
MPDVTAKLKPFRPKLPRKIPAQLRAEPRSNRYTVVGTAFDYLLRFELQRRAPHAVSEPWAAEHAPGIIWSRDAFMSLWKDDKGVVSLATGPDARFGDEELARETAERASRVVEKAKAAVAAYVRSKSPTPREQADVAGHAIRLAKLEETYRAWWRFDPSFEEAAQEDVEDLLGILAIMPFESLLHEKILLLNPTFGETSRLVGGADADLIAGNLLVDFKVTKRGEMDVNNLDQLLGYFLLARHQRRKDAKFPEIKRVALYFCRHAHLWELDVTTWTKHPEFPEIEEWFFKRAKAVFGASRAIAKTRNRQ